MSPTRWTGPHFAVAKTTLTFPPFLTLDATTDISIWSNVEGGLGITAGSLTTLRPLFRILRDGSLSITPRSRTSRSRNTPQFGNNLPSDQNKVHVRSSLRLSRESREDPANWRPDLELDSYQGHSTTIFGKGHSIATNSSEEGLYPKDTIR